MTSKRIYFGRTTPQQRQLLFQIWQETGNVTHACSVARVGRRTFYHWKPRFEALGFVGLESFASTAPQHPHQTNQVIAEQVMMLKQTNLSWGKRRIAQELAKANNWKSVLSPNTVRRILEAASLWQQVPEPKKRVSKRVSVLPSKQDKP